MSKRPAPVDLTGPPEKKSKVYNAEYADICFKNGDTLLYSAKRHIFSSSSVLREMYGESKDPIITIQLEGYSNEQIEKWIEFMESLDKKRYLANNELKYIIRLCHKYDTDWKLCEKTFNDIKNVSMDLISEMAQASNTVFDNMIRHAADHGRLDVDKMISTGVILNLPKIMIVNIIKEHMSFVASQQEVRYSCLVEEHRKEIVYLKQRFIHASRSI